MRTYVGLAIVGALIVGLFGYTKLTSPPVTQSQGDSFEVTFSVEGTEEHRVRVEEGTTALDLLREEAREYGFALAEKEYAGLGVLVEQIGSFKNGTNGKYWHYYVNSSLAPVGAESYILKNNDMIEWKFHEPRVE